VLQRLGARAALVTTKGFRDVLELRRIRAPLNYDPFFDKPKPLIDRRLRLEIDERISATGEVLKPLEERDLKLLKKQLVENEVEAVAVCLLHSYAYPQHEQAIGVFLARELPELSVSLSCDVLPERREYERTATTVVNTYVRPTMKCYLEALGQSLQELGIEAPLRIMHSAGGLTTDSDAARRPVFLLESGPAAGVLAAQALARQTGLRNVISFDMGGTTAKASLIEEQRILYTSEYEVGASISSGSRLLGGGGELVRAPTIDIAEVGAGGGSIAVTDGAGGVRVGPQSAGAVPGPACYQLGGTEPTVTDANVVLGYIRPGRLADGDITIDLDVAKRVINDCVARPLGLNVYEAAEGIHRIANARMMRTLRSVSTARGRDPRKFSMVAFGGSGPVHVAGLARELAIQKILVPRMPGLFSTIGLLMATIERHAVQSCSLVGDQIRPSRLSQIQHELKSDLWIQFTGEGIETSQVDLTTSLDMRFQGQTSEININLLSDDFTDDSIEQLKEAFHREHLQLYGHLSQPDNLLEIVAVRMVGRTRKRSVNPMGGLVSANGNTGTRRAYFGERWGFHDVPVLSRHDLRSKVVL
jgi:N-methylhydantoinase A